MESRVAGKPEDSTSPPSPPSYIRKPLSCVTCRLKKIRCDKKIPCFHCVKSNIQCTFPVQRKPRERKRHLKHRQSEMQHDDGGGGDKGLVDRLRALEIQVSALRTQLKDGNGGVAPPPKHHLTKRTMGNNRGDHSVAVSHIKSSFWTSINFQLEKHLILQRSNGFGVKMDATLAANGDPGQSHSDVSMLLFNSFQGLQYSVHTPSETHIMLFWEIFKNNVEPMVKMLHVPTTAKLVERALWDRYSLSAAENALLFSIYYITTLSMNEDVIIREFSVSKSALLSRMRVLAEQALMAAKFATAPSITLLQAVMFFVLVLRKTGEARSAGGLVGVVVHLSQCLRLHKDDAGIGTITPFEREMRRRLAWAVLVLDNRSSEDLGTDAMISEEAWETPLPLNINDDDISENSTDLPVSREGMTEMAFSLIRLHVLRTSLRVRRLAAEEPYQTIEGLDEICEKIWQKTWDMLEAKYLNPNPGHELVWAAKSMAYLLISKMKLLDQCSFYAPEHANMMTEAMHSRSTAHLESAIRVMEENHSANVDYRWTNWKWIFVAYSRWQGSAILFKEILRRQWTPISEQGWITLHKIMSDSKLGELECLRDQPVMPLPFSFIYELTKNYRESEFARLRNQPEEAQRLWDEAVRDSRACGEACSNRSASGDRPGVSASSLERWRHAAGLATCISDLPASVPPRAFSDITRTGFNGNGVACDIYTDAYHGIVLPTEPPARAAGTESQWRVGELMPVECMQNILDELF